MFRINDIIIDETTKEQYKIIDFLYYEDDYSHLEQTRYVLENINTKEKIEIDVDSEFIDPYSPWRYYISIEEYENPEAWCKKILFL